MAATLIKPKPVNKGPVHKWDEAELIQKVRNGDSQAFVTLTNRYSEKLYRKAYSMVSNAEDAQDVLQEALLSAYKAFPRFRAESGVYTWLYRIVVNKAKDFLSKRKNKRENLIDSQEIQFEDGRVNYERNVELDDDTRYLLETINTLDRIYRDILIQRYFDELSYQEIAKLGKINIGTVKSRLFKAKEILKKKLVQSGRGGDFFAL